MIVAEQTAQALAAFDTVMPLTHLLARLKYPALYALVVSLLVIVVRVCAEEL